MTKGSRPLRVSPQVVSLRKFSQSATPAALRHAEEAWRLALPSQNGNAMGLYLSKASGKQITEFLRHPEKWGNARYQYSDRYGRICIAHGLGAYIDAAPGLRARMGQLNVNYHALLSASSSLKTRTTALVARSPTNRVMRPEVSAIKLGRPKHNFPWINADKLDRFLLQASRDDVKKFLKDPGSWLSAKYAHCSDGGRKHEHGSLEQYLRARPELQARLRKLKVKHPALKAINMPKRALRTASEGTGSARTIGAVTLSPPSPTTTRITSSNAGADQDVRLRKENKKRVYMTPDGIPATSQVSKNSGILPAGEQSRLRANGETPDIASAFASRHIEELIVLRDAKTALPLLASNDIGTKLDSAPAGQPCTFFLRLVSTGEIYACEIARIPPNQRSPASPIRLPGSRRTTPPLPSYQMTVLGTAPRNTNRGTQETPSEVLVRKLQVALSRTKYANIQINVRSLALLSGTSRPEADTLKRPPRTSLRAAHLDITQFLAGKLPPPHPESSDFSASVALSHSQKSPSTSPRDPSDNQSSGPPPNSVDSNIGHSNAQTPNDIALKAAEDNEMEYFAPDLREHHIGATLAFAVLPGAPADNSRILFANAVGNTLDEWACLDSKPRTFFLHMQNHWLAGLARRQENGYEIAMFSSIAPTEGEFVPANFTALMRPAFAEFLQRAMATQTASTNTPVSDVVNIELTLCARSLQDTSKLSEACGYVAMHMAHQVHRTLQYQSKPGAPLAASFEDACTAWEQQTDQEKSDILNGLKKRMQPSSDKTPASSTNTIGEQ